VLQVMKSRNHKEQGQPLDPENRRTVGSGTPSPIAHLGVQRLRGVTFDIRSREVSRAEARVETWQNHKVGPA
jgi:hypothetical protein